MRLPSIFHSCLISQTATLTFLRKTIYFNEGSNMPKVSKAHLKKDKKESKAIYKCAEKIESNAEKLMERDKKVKKKSKR